MKSIIQIINEEIQNVIKSPQEIANSLTIDPSMSYTKNHILANVDMELADDAFSRDTGYYIGRDDKGILNRRVKVNALINSGELKYAPIVTIVMGNSGKPYLSFTDGRHRFAELRDAGVKTINLAVSPESKKYIPLLQSGNLNEKQERFYDNYEGIAPFKNNDPIKQVLDAYTRGKRKETFPYYFYGKNGKVGGEVQAAPIFIRFGLPPANQKNSTMFRFGTALTELEGVSVFEAGYTGRVIMVNVGSSLLRTDFDELMHQPERLVYVVTGKFIGEGSDGEPLLDPKTVKVITEVPRTVLMESN